ncbi:MAG: hypothetical protein M1819_001195 [Sarea resinae]|nr:MAG: hypothetical protein M1819_001195 [Sarea resinae]
MTDRRRINGPSGGTIPPVFASSITGSKLQHAARPTRTRGPNDLRKIFLKTGLVPSASGSAYLELEPSSPSDTLEASLIAPPSALKLTCTVHGPRPLPRSAPFSPHLLLSTHVKFAPFAARQRRSYIRDASERDLGVHLETALRGVILGDRWPKSGVEVVITVLEGEEDRWWGDEVGGGSTGIGNVGGWGMMNVLAGCITVASAAIADAGIDCVDLVSGGIAAIVKAPQEHNEDKTGSISESLQLVLDPCPSEHRRIVGACVVGYLASRDEITELWLKGDIPPSSYDTKDPGQTTVGLEKLVDGAVIAAGRSCLVLREALKEAAELKLNPSGGPAVSDENKGQSSGPDEAMDLGS